MLRSLHVSNYVLIDSLDITFPEGLVIITGQTGAGKSILLGALSLLTGSKADATAISEGADNCVVEALFDEVPAGARAVLDEADAEWDDGELLVRRVVSRSGRSRSFVNDCPVSVGVLQSLAPYLVDIHSQHKSLLLTDRQFQMSVLDRYAGNAALLEECGGAWSRLCAAQKELEQATGKLERLSREQEYNRVQLEQLEAASLREDEIADLEQEQRELANAEDLKASLAKVSSLAESDDRARSVLDALKDARRGLDRIKGLVPSAADLSSRLESARIEIEDIVSDVSALDSRLSVSQERLESVEQRLSLLYTLLGKHGCATEAELIAVKNNFALALFDTEELQERIAHLQSEISSLQDSYDAAAAALSASRRSAAPRYASAICSQLRYLELENAVFEVCLSPAPAGARGTDCVQYLFSSTGSALQDVGRCASGGEISRIMLCLKSMMAKFTGMPALVFDEIDTGVSGSVADKMGRMICAMGESMQVFSITHLPQVAAKGNAHYVVSRHVREDGRTVSGIAEVTGEQRVREIARMLSGAAVSEAALANARALLEE